MSKHLSGPWNLTLFKDEQGYPVEVEVSDGSMSLHLSDVDTWEDKWPEGIATARLIAAAPEMLEALKLVAEFGCECHDEPERHPCMVCIANEAIAKAEGRDD